MIYVDKTHLNNNVGILMDVEVALNPIMQVLFLVIHYIIIFPD